ncbi:MAG: hypothetical protein JWL96_1641, partial [Sphingomonas bacterium]|uniref:hypothetical protein n=1 Tax=Sphingomonas bacterium TaxID=1895847 RepID=UPI002609FE42
TLTAWKAAPVAQDQHNAERNGSGSMWLSGVVPNVTTADIRINPASAAATIATAGITQNSVDACLARPRDYAAGIAHVKHIATATPVWDGMA